MIALDINTILSVTALNLFAVSAALPLIMGDAVSRSVRWVQSSLLAQAGAWVCLVSAEFALDMPLSVLAMVLGSLANYSVYKALQGWIGTRPGHSLLLVACVVMPVGYALSFDHYPLRVGWANGWLAVQMTVVARACLWPEADWGTHWRRLLAVCYSTVALLTLGRGILGAFYTELYPTFTTPHPLNLLAQLAANTAMPLTTVALLVAWRKEVENRLRDQALTDGLTHLSNRRGMMTVVPQLLAQAQRQRWPIALLMLDLDHFKRVNDEHGHEGGDRALKLFADVLRHSLRDNDVGCRMGGEEFILLLPHTEAAGAAQLDGRIRARLLERSTAELGWPVNFSTGLAMCDLTDADPVARATQAADQALYEAKRLGRGRLFAAPGSNSVGPPGPHAGPHPGQHAGPS